MQSRQRCTASVESALSRNVVVESIHNSSINIVFLRDPIHRPSCNSHTVHSRKLANNLSITRTIDVSSAALGLVVFASSVLLDLIAPAELVLNLTALNALELFQEFDTSGTRLIAAVLERELVVARAHGDALDGDESGGSAGGHDLVERGDFLVLDLMEDRLLV
jgi:hypothetical protein